jgi:hypothetical protein
LLAPRPTPKLEDHPLPYVRGCLFNIFAALCEENKKKLLRRSFAPRIDEIKVKYLCNRLRKPLGLRDIEAPALLDNQLTDGGEVVSCHLHPGRLLVITSVIS